MTSVWRFERDLLSLIHPHPPRTRASRRSATHDANRWEATESRIFAVDRRIS